MSASRLNRIFFRAILPALTGILFPLGPAALHAQALCSGTSSDGQVTVEIQVNRPAAGQFIAAGPACPASVPVEGVASAVGLPPSFDLYIAIDASGSTGACTGVDVDGDGFLGMDSGPGRCTDRDDSIYQAELEAADRLLDQLDLAQARIGLISFSDPRSTFEVQELTDDRDVLRSALDNLRRRGPFGATDFEGPQLLARDRLQALGDPTRSWIVLFLSDGSPTFPVMPFDTTQGGDTQAARDAASALARAGITEHTYAIGGAAATNTLRSMAALTGGRFFLVRNPGDVVDILPTSVLTGIDLLVVENRTLQEAVNPPLNPLGEFQADLPVTQGWNDVLVTAQAFRKGQVQVPCPVRFFFACGRGCQPNTQGFWHRQCLATGEIRPGQGRPELDLHVDEFTELQEIVDLLLAFSGQDTCEALDTDPASDPCERALKQYAAFLLNVAEGRLGAACTVDPQVVGGLASPAPDPLPTTIEGWMPALEELLQEGLAGDPDRCKEVNDIADAINTGEAVGDPAGSNVRMVAQPLAGRSSPATLHGGDFEPETPSDADPAPRRRR